MKRTEYLQRPLIEGVVFEITSENIRIYNDNTLFLGVRHCYRVTLTDIRRRFTELQDIAKTAERLRLKGSTKFMPAVRELYPSYRAACDDIERLFTEIGALVSQIRKEGLHKGWIDDEVLEAAIRKQNEIEKHYYRNSAYSRFLDYDQRLCGALTDRPWEDDFIVDYTVTIA